MLIWLTRVLFTMIILVTTVLVLPASALSGREVCEKVHEVRSKALDRKTEAVMVLFDKGGGKRTRTLTEYGKKAENIPTPFRLGMENRKTNHRTELTVESIRYHTQFPDELFSQRSLERAGK